MATFLKRGKKYQVQIRRKGLAPVSKTFHLKADAEQWARHMESKADRGDLPTSTKELHTQTLRNILERYRDEICPKKRGVKIETYIINAFLRQSFSNLSLAQLTSAHFSRYREQRLKTVKAGTINRELGVIQHALHVAEKEWDIPLQINPLVKLSKIRANNARSRRLSDLEFSALQEASTHTRNPYIMFLVRFAIATGMRKGEIMRLRWNDIDTSKHTLHIPLTKNGYSRTIPLSSEALNVLDELRVKIEYNKPIRPESVFPLSDNAAKLAWQRLVKRAGIDNLHFHDLRHEAVSSFFERGLSVPEVALISGHRDFRMLFRYTHLKAEEIALKLALPSCET